MKTYSTLHGPSGKVASFVTTAGTEVAQQRRDRPNTIQLGEVAPARIWWDRARLAFKMLDGNVVVEMEPAYEQASASIVVPGLAAGRLRPDTGTVLAVGAGVYELEPGDRVCVLPYDGKAFNGFCLGGYATRNRIRFLGCDSMNEYEQHHTHYTELIPGRLMEVESKVWKVQPIGHWVLIKRDVLHKSSAGGIELPESMQFREQTATVVSIGARVPGHGREVWPEPGDRVIYQGKALVIDFEFGERYGFTGDPKAHCFIHVDDLHAIIP